MIKSNYFPNIEFKSNEEFFSKLKDYEKDIIDFKQSQIYKSRDKGQSVRYVFDDNNTTIKANLKAKDNFIYPVINSTGFLDYHDDVHFKGCYTKTVKEQQGRVFFVDTHGRKMSDIISRKSDIKMFVSDLSWNDLGQQYDGTTQCMVFEISRDKVRPDALDLMDSEPDLECSISMKYVKMFLAINSEDPNYKTNKEYWDSRIGDVINSDKANKLNYFFGVEELAIINEGSLCPITGGSNEATRVYQNRDVAVDDTTKEPLENTQTIKRRRN